MSSHKIIRVLTESKWSKLELICDDEKLIVRKTIKDESLAKTEIKILSSLSHPNIIPLVKFNLKSRQIYMPYVPSTLIDIVNCGPIDEKYIKIYFRQIFSAIKYLYDKGVSHRDIKLDNILLRENHCYLIDFGFAHTLEEGKKITKDAGSLKYVPPEILMGLPFDPIKADVWSLAVCIYSCLTTNFPTSSRYNNISRIVYPRNTSPDLKDLLNHMFVVNPGKRYHINDLIEHDWIKKD